MKQFKLFFACALMLFFGLGQVWADVESGTTYSTPSATGVPTGWTSSDGGGTSYVKLTESTHYISTEEFCQNGFTSIVLKARKFNGPSAEQLVITVEWIESGESPVVLGTVSPTGTSLTNYTISSPATVTGNKAGAIKISCKGASGGKGSGVSEVTINYTEGTCGGGTPTCATPTFSPAAGSYEGTQNVTITSTTGSTIYYTTDGTDPKTSGTKQTYSAAVTVAADMTLKAYAVKAGSNDSEVGTAAYVITEGPDVTINLLDDGWGFPTSKVIDETSYTNGGYTVKVAGTTGNGFRTYGTYFLLGQNGAYLELPAFANPIKKIVVAGNSGGSGSVAWNIFKGDDAVSTAATGCGNAAYTFNIDPMEASVVYRIKVTSAANLQIKTIKIYYGAAPAVAKPTISGDENFVGSTTVTITHADADAIYYTTDGSDPKTSGTKQTYSVPFTVNADGTTTVKAYAVKGSDESDVAEKTFTKVDALESLAALLEATTSTETAFNVVISNWVVTGVNGSRAWIADAANEKGILLYKSGHNFVAGNKLNGVVLGTKTKLYQGYPEMTTLVSTDVTVTTAETVTPRVTTIAALTSGYNKEQGTVVKLENLTYTASTTSFSDGVNTLALNTQLYNPTMLDGAIYTIIGVVRYDNEAAISIMPRSVDDVEQTGGGGMPEVDGLAALKAETTGSSYLLNLTDAIVTLVDGSNAFIEDATAGALIYKSGHGFSAGDKLNGQYEVTTATYQGKFEITAIAATTGTKTTGAAIPETTLTIAQLNANFAANESKRIKIVGVNVTDAVESGDATARTGEISDGVNTITLYAGKSGVTAAENANIDVIGYPTYHNTDEQLAVWAQADITVNVKDDPELSYSPASVNLTVGDALSAPTFNNPHTLSPITYSTDNDAVATVDEYGAIALAGGTGTAVITASYAGDATYNAGNATFTITVSAADSRKSAVGPAEFTTTSGFLTPSDILYISHKGGASTAPGNYNSGIRLYQISGTNTYGGYVTLIAKKGCKIDEVEITTTSKYATTVGYYVDADEAAIQGSADVAKSGTYNTATGLNADSVRILNLGTGSNGRLEIASITVYYTGDAAAVDHYELGGSYQTDFEIDDAFNHDGLEVYMAYDAGGTEKLNLTAGCTFSDPDMTAAGTPTVEISFGTTVITSYDITVAASTLLDPELSYDPTSVTLTQGDALSAPTLNNPHTLDLTFNSNKTAVATVDEFGVITLAGGTGTATITASFAGDATYQAGNATFTITVNEPEEDLTGTWEFATSVAAGDRIIIASIAEAGEVTTMGAQGSSNRGGVASTVAGTELTPAAGSKSVTLVDAGEGKFALQLNNGSYLYASSNSSNQLKETAAYADNENAKWTFAFDGEGVATITAQGTNSHNVMRYNPNSGSPLFACYTSTSTTGTLVTVYKKAVPVKDLVRGDLSVGKWGTLCPKQNVENVEGATFYQIAYLEEQAGLPYNMVWDAISGTTLEAGKPYFFIANATEIRGNKTGVAVTEADPAGVNGFYGWISPTDEVKALTWKTDYVAGEDNTFVIYNNEVLRLNAATNLKSERCYININATEPTRAGVAPMPGRDRIRMSIAGVSVVTGCENIEASDKPIKMMINGQLFILRGEKLYNANGQLVK